MIIGYRRFGSSLGITEKEDYKIGGWHEKRLALVETLRNRGHEVYGAPSLRNAARDYGIMRRI